MSAALSISKEQEDAMIKEATAAVAARLLTERRNDLDCLTASQVCGHLNITPKTLDGLKDGPPRVQIVPGSCVRYRACDVAKYIESRIAR